MTAPPTRALIQCDGAPIPSNFASEHWDAREALTATGDAPEVNLRIEGLHGKVIKAIDGRAADLIRIATFCYIADQYVSRGGSRDVHRERWRRHLAICIEVTEPAFWSSPDVLTDLTAALAFATDDEWTFHFSKAAPVIGVSQLPLDLDDHKLFGEPDSVLLFSGGTDSLCALVEALHEGRRPLLVSHTPARHIDARIAQLLKQVRRDVAGDWALPQLTFDIHRVVKEPASSSQRTRAFLYAALGVAVSLQVGLPEVVLADNGYVSLNPSISGQIVGALASRGTHPTFLRLMNRLLEHLGPRPPRLENTLAPLTRAEAFTRLADRGAAHLLTHTHSCGKNLRLPGHPHCGHCSQCIDRRFAFLASGLTELDRETVYTLDVFTDPLPTGEARQAALSYVSFAQQTAGLTDEQLMETQQELILQAIDVRAGAAMVMLEAARLLRRHGQEVLTGMTVSIAAHSDALASRALAEDGLLRLYLAADDRPMPGQELPPTDDAHADVDPVLDIRANRGLVFITWEGAAPEAYRWRKGFRRLQLLVLHTNRAISALQLMRLAEGVAAPDEAAREFKGLVDGFHPDDTERAEPIISKQDRQQIFAQLVELEKLAADARAAGQLRRVQDYEDQSAAIRKLLKSVTGLHGRLRPDPTSEIEKARKNVSRTIHEVLGEIKERQPSLGFHLEESLHLGTYCSYHPDPPKRWRIAA